MVDITESRDCGNPAKNRFAQTIGVAMESAVFLSDAFSDDMIWEYPGGVATGGEAVALALANVEKPVRIVVEHAITHGKVGATSSSCTLGNGNKRRFSHVIAFTNTKATKVAKIQSFR